MVIHIIANILIIGNSRHTILIIYIIVIILIILIFVTGTSVIDSILILIGSDCLKTLQLFQVRIDLGLSDHIWVDKRAAIAKKFDDLGDQFRLIRTGWLAYIAKTYWIQDISTETALGQDALIVPDDDI